MPRKRRQHDARFKFKVALEAARGLRTINEIASENNVHPNQVSSWKKQLLEEGPAVFSGKNGKQQREQEGTEADLYEQIGRLKMELEWLKKKLPPSAKAKRTMIEPAHSQLSIRRQCELVDLSRASYYYTPAGESPFNLLLMRLIDEQYLRTPFYGRHKMAAPLQRQGYDVNHKRVGRLMRKMGLQALCPRPRTSIADQQHKKYPYLLRGLDINRPNLV